MAKRANRRHRKYSLENDVKKSSAGTMANPITAQPVAEMEMTDVGGANRA